mgnify:CR=1 FL=1
MRFYKLYLNNDYKACKEIYEKILSIKDFGNDLLSEVQTKYTYAVACFYANDIQKAKEILPAKVEFYAKIMQVEPASVKINSAKKRYGSCSGSCNTCKKCT